MAQIMPCDNYCWHQMCISDINCLGIKYARHLLSVDGEVIILDIVCYMIDTRYIVCVIRKSLAYGMLQYILYLVSWLVREDGTMSENVRRYVIDVTVTPIGSVIVETRNRMLAQVIERHSYTDMKHFIAAFGLTLVLAEDAYILVSANHD